MPESAPNQSEEPVREWTFQGQVYRVPESKWPEFSAQAAQLLGPIFARALDEKVEEVKEYHAGFQAAEDYFIIGPFLIHTLLNAPTIADYAPSLSVAQAMVAGVSKAAATGDLAGTCAAVREAQEALNLALGDIEDYLARRNSRGEFVVTYCEVVQTAAFAAFSVAAGAAAAATWGLGAAASGAIGSGGAAFLQNVINVAADVAVGPNTKTVGQNVKSVLISTVLNAAGGAAGGVIADRIKGPVIAELVRLHRSELQGVSDKLLTQIVTRVTEAFGGGFSNTVQSLIADAGSVALGEMTFEQFEERVVQNLIANGIGGAIMGAAGANAPVR